MKKIYLHKCAQLFLVVSLMASAVGGLTVCAAEDIPSMTEMLYNGSFDEDKSATVGLFQNASPEDMPYSYDGTNFGYANMVAGSSCNVNIKGLKKNTVYYFTAKIAASESCTVTVKPRGRGLSLYGAAENPNVTLTAYESGDSYREISGMIETASSIASSAGLSFVIDTAAYLYADEIHFIEMPDVGVNAVINGDFENTSSFTQWRAVGDASAELIDNGEVINGSGALKVTAAAGGGVMHKAYFMPGKSYHITASVRIISSDEPSVDGTIKVYPGSTVSEAYQTFVSSEITCDSSQESTEIEMYYVCPQELTGSLTPNFISDSTANECKIEIGVLGGSTVYVIDDIKAELMENLHVTDSETIEVYDDYRTYIKVYFSHLIDAETAVDTGNYASTEASVEEVSLCDDGMSCIVKLDRMLSADTEHILSVSGVKDFVGRTMNSEDITFTCAERMNFSGFGIYKDYGTSSSREITGSEIESGNISAVINTVESNTVMPKNVTLAVCLYKDESLADIKFMSARVASGFPDELKAAVTVPDNLDDGVYELKTFVIGSFANAVPVFDTILTLSE